MERNDFERGIDLTQLWGIFYLRWRIIAAAFAAALAIAVITQVTNGSSANEITPVAPTTYTASAVYAVIPVAEGTPMKADEAALLSQALAGTYRYALTTNSVSEALVAELGLGISAREVSDHVTISLQSATQFILLTSEMSDAASAIAVANGYAQALAASDVYSSVDLGSVQIQLKIIEPA